MKIPLASPLIGLEEAQAVRKIVESRWIREGEKVKEFEKSFAQHLGVKHAIATSSGTSALICAMMALNIGSGDEVIIPSLSCSPPASATLGLGAKPVFVDVELQTYNIDPEDVRRKITEKTKLVVPIHYGGCPADLNSLMEICEDNNVTLFEDAAEALGAEYENRKVGTFGKISVFSFSPNKTITTGEGGMITTNNDELMKRVRMIKDYGQDKRFHYVVLGYNFRMTEMQAGLGIVQLKKVDKIIQSKRRNARYLTKLLTEVNGIIPPLEESHIKHAYMLYTIRITKECGLTRDKLMKMLDENEIQSRIYFPPLHLQPLFTTEIGQSKLPVVEKISKEILSLPSAPTLKISDVEYIAHVIVKAKTSMKLNRGMEC